MFLFNILLFLQCNQSVKHHEGYEFDSHITTRRVVNSHQGGGRPVGVVDKCL